MIFYLKVSFVIALALVLIPFSKSEYDKQYLIGTFKAPFNKWQRR